MTNINGTTTTYSRVRDQLRADILSGQFESGARLTVAMLQERYATSSMPVRVALQEMQGEGLVQMEPRRGARVRMVDEEYISNIYDLRIAVLGLLYPKAVRFITNAEIEEIEHIEDQVDAARERNELAAAWRAAYKFHERIHRIARNPEAYAVMERTYVLVNALRAKFGFGKGRLEDASRNHRRIVEALRERDAQTALSLAQQSADRARKDLINLLRSENEPEAAHPPGSQDIRTDPENIRGNRASQAGV